MNKSKSINTIFIGIELFALFLGSLIMPDAYSDEYYVNKTNFILEKNGRDFSSLSIHPNGEDWLFTECSKDFDPNGDCYVLRFNLLNKKLQRYNLPSNYLYGFVKFSPSGKYIVFNRAPKHDGSEDGFRRSIEKSEILMMQSDGKNFTIIPLNKDIKFLPIMSHDETKIAYWRSAALLPSKSRVLSIDFDVYEYDLKNKNEKLFSGPHHFLDAGELQYFSNNEIILSSYGPRKYGQSIGAYLKKFNGSEVYKLERGEMDLPTPLFVEIGNVRNPSIDENGKIYLSGQPPSLGMSFVKISPMNEVIFWQANKELAMSGFKQITVSPNGKYIAFIYVAAGKNYRDNKNSFGLFDVSNSNWTSIVIPDLTKYELIEIEF